MYTLTDKGTARRNREIKKIVIVIVIKKNTEAFRDRSLFIERGGGGGGGAGANKGWVTIFYAEV